jgi:hypothetical protein
MRTDPVAFMSLNFIIWRYLLRGVAPHTLSALCIPIVIGIVDNLLFIEGYLEDPEGTEEGTLQIMRCEKTNTRYSACPVRVFSGMTETDLHEQIRGKNTCSKSRQGFLFFFPFLQFQLSSIHLQ